MRGLKVLERDLGKIFGGKQPPKKDAFRSARAKAKALASKHGIEVERLDGGMNVWAPDGLGGPDPFEGDHFANDWAEALSMVTTYARLLGDQMDQGAA